MAVPFLPPWTREDRSRAVQVCVPRPCVPSELALKAAGLGAGSVDAGPPSVGAGGVSLLLTCGCLRASSAIPFK